MSFITKRIIFYPKKSIMEIDGPSFYKSYAYESSMQENEIVIFSENKAKELVAAGTKITKEMLDAMEFSSSTTEESITESSETNVEKKPSIENIDKIVAEEFRAQIQKNIQESSEDSSEKECISDADNEIEKNKKVADVTDALEQLGLAVDVSHVSDAVVETNEKTDLEAAVEKMSIVETENTMLEEETTHIEHTVSVDVDKQPDVVVSIGEVKVVEIINEPETVVDPEPVTSEENIYHYKPVSIDLLSAKVLAERIKTVFGCNFLDFSNNNITVNSSFKKSFYNKFAKILDEEIKQDDLNDKYKDSLRRIRKELLDKHGSASRKDVDVRYTVDEILKIKERCEIPINIDRSIFVIPIKKEPKEDPISLFRLELNRIAWANSNATIERIKKIRIRRDDEIRKMADILFEKAVQEDTFCKLYAFVVQQLYKTFKSEEEKKRSVDRNVFFNTLIKLCQSALSTKEKWAKTHDLSMLSREERISMEETLEEENIEKELKKTRVLGTVKFISSLYSYNVIGFKGISFCINTLADLEDEQNVEILCSLIVNCGENMVKNGKSAELTAAINKLKKPHNWCNRIKFMVYDVIERSEEWIKSKQKESPFKNSFSSLKDEQDKTEDKLVDSLEDVPENKYAAAETRNADSEDMLMDTIDMMGKILEDVPHTDDYSSLISEMKKRTAGLSTKMVLESYFIYMIEFYDTFDSYLRYLHVFLKSIDVDGMVINKSLKTVEANLPNIVVDSPYAKSNFHLLVYCIKQWTDYEIDIRDYDTEDTRNKYKSFSF